MNVVKFFNGIEHANLGKHSKNVKENLSSILNLEKNETSDSLFLAFSGIETEHWKIILSQRNLFLLNSYNAAMYYYDKGIYDEDFLKNSKKINWENHFNYRYFIESFFLSGSSVLDNVAYLLKVFYDLKLNDKERISFKNIVEKLNSKKVKNNYDLKGTEQLLKKLNDIRINDQRFIKMNIIRNDIAHNNPPLTLTNPVSKLDGITVIGTGTYQDSAEVKKIMDDFLEVYVEVIDILLNISKMLNNK